MVRSYERVCQRRAFIVVHPIWLSAMCTSPMSSTACQCSTQHLLHNYVSNLVDGLYLRSCSHRSTALEGSWTRGNDWFPYYGALVEDSYTVAPEGQEGGVTNSECQEIRGQHHCDEHQTSYASFLGAQLPRYYSHSTMLAKYFHPTVVKILGNQTSEKFLHLPSAQREQILAKQQVCVSQAVIIDESGLNNLLNPKIA